MATKFEAFDRADVAYSKVNDHEIFASILTPVSLRYGSDGSRPVIVFWHGGGFIVGHRMYEPWWSQWLIEFALEEKAIIISPDYRLLPESNGSDTLSDVENFWKWLQNSLPQISTDWHVRPDLTKILCAGQSSGGRLAVQSALLFPSISNIKALISISAPLHGNVPHYTIPYPKIIMGSRPPPSREAEAYIRSYIKGITPGTIVSCRDAAELWELVMCIIQQGWLPRLMGGRRDRRLDLMGLLDEVQEMPPIWIVHGQDDTVAPVVCSVKYAENIESKPWDSQVMLSVKPGEHAFDTTLTMQCSWIAEGCAFSKRHWLGAEA